MSKERLYGWNGELPIKEKGGQAAIVFRGLRAEPEALKTGHEWAESIGHELRTRQDPYRVVLYYILIFKGEGLIRTNEYDINATTRKEDVKRGITIKTNAMVEERYTSPLVEPKPETEPVDNRFWPNENELNSIEQGLKACAELLAEK